MSKCQEKQEGQEDEKRDCIVLDLFLVGYFALPTLVSTGTAPGNTAQALLGDFNPIRTLLVNRRRPLLPQGHWWQRTTGSVIAIENIILIHKT